MMRSLRLCFIALAYFCAAQIDTVHAADTFTFDPAHSRIAFKVKQAFATVNGRFTKFHGTIQLDREQPEKSSVVATILVKSIDTGIAKRDVHLRSAEFFNAEKFPEITFKSRSAKQTALEEGDIVGDFSMHGVIRPMTLRVKLLNKDDKVTGWQVTTQPISRRDFGTQFGKSLEAVSMISDKVVPDIEIVAMASR